MWVGVDGSVMVVQTQAAPVCRRGVDPIDR